MSQEYRLLDSGNFEKLEQVGDYKIVRPALGAVWKPRLSPDEWAEADARFERNPTGNGRWHVRTQIPEQWPICIGKLSFHIRLTGFGHLGLFAEQERNWSRIEQLVAEIRGQQKPKILNLFAYTGGSTLAGAVAGAEVVHLDASKTSVAWARENAALSGLDQASIRWIVDDVVSFVARETRRGSKYHGIILDPPSFGRGAKKQVWKIESHLTTLLEQLRLLLDDDFKFILLSSHSPGYTPISLRNLLHDVCESDHGEYEPEEMLITDMYGRALPSGASCLFVRS